MGPRVPFFELNSGCKIPSIGFGTYLITGLEEVTRVLDEALNAGYRLFDTARMYENEKEIGTALKRLLPKYNLKRSDVYLTTKLWTDEHGGGSKTETAVRNSIKDLQSDYVDLFLIHWPGVDGLNPGDPENAAQRRLTWSSLVKLQKEGLIKSIGVSNYNVRHIREMTEYCEGVMPAVNQVEWHPHHHPQSLLDECRTQGILLQAFSSLGGYLTKDVLNDPQIQQIADKANLPIGSLLLKWAVQQNIAVIPKASSTKHIRQNIELDFTIPENIMNELSNLPTKIKYDWDPDKVF